MQRPSSMSFACYGSARTLAKKWWRRGYGTFAGGTSGACNWNGPVTMLISAPRQVPTLQHTEHTVASGGDPLLQQQLPLQPKSRLAVKLQPKLQIKLQVQQKSCLQPNSTVHAESTVHSDCNEPPEYDKEKQKQMADFGELIQALRAQTPGLLSTPYSRELLSPGITLRLVPALVPPIKGGVLGYFAAVRVLQVVAAAAVPGHNEIRVVGEMVVKSPAGKPVRYVMRWCTARKLEDEDEDQVDGTLTGDSKRALDGIPVVMEGDHLGEKRWNESLEELEQEEGEDDKVVYGIFEFEFENDLKKVLVHTIRNVELIDEGVYGTNLAPNM